MLENVRLAGVIVLALLASVHDPAWASPERVDAPDTALVEALLGPESVAERDLLLARRRGDLTTAVFRELMARGLARVGLDPNSALPVFETALAVAERLDDRGLRATALTHLALLHVLRGEVETAERRQDEAQRLAAESGELRARAYVLSRGAELHVQRGRYAEARAFLEQCRDLFAELGDTVELGRAHGNLARIALDLGEYRRAAEDYARSVEVLERLGPSVILGRALNGLGTAHLSVGQNLRALEFFQRALRTAETFGNRVGEMEALDDIAAVHAAQGDYALALQHSEKAVTRARQVGLEPYLGLVLLNAGRIYGEAGQRAAAARRFQEAARLAERTETRWLQLHALTGLGQLALAEDRLEASRGYHERTLALADAIGARSFVCWNLADISEIHYRRHEYAQALDTSSRAAELARQDGNLLCEWRPQLVRARSLRALGRTSEARRFLDESLATIETLRRQSLETSRQWFLEEKVSPYHEAVDLCVSEGDLPSALAYAERAKARALLDTLRADEPRGEPSLSAEESGRERELLGRLRELNGKRRRELFHEPPNPATLDRLREQLARARLDFEGFEAALRVAHPGLGRQRGELRAWDLRSATDSLLDDDTAILEFVVTDQRTHVLVLRAGSGGSGARLAAHTTELTRQQLRQKVRRFRRRVAGREVGFAADARGLYSLLLGPLEAEIAGKSVLVVVPDDVLWELPFQALLSGDGRFVAESRAIYSVPSLAVLRDLAAAGRRTTADAAPRLLAFGDPSLGDAPQPRRTGRREAKLEPLPEARAEVRTIARLYGPASTVRTGARATEGALKAEAAGHDVIHLAAHATLDSANPLYSHVVLAQDDVEDGLLEAWEIRRMRLTARLVVLSACRTGGGRLTAGEGLVGTSWALFAAGASAAVVSQWEVDSASTAQLMVEFHRQWLTAGTSKAEALRRASLKLLRSARHRHPYYWAGFVVLGASGP